MTINGNNDTPTMVARLIFALTLTIATILLIHFWPAVSSGAVVSFLNKWQTLVGAAIGGTIGLLAALIVAHDARRRKERSAGWLILYELMTALAAREQVTKAFEATGIAEGQRDDWVAKRLRKDRPRLSSSFETSAVAVMSVDEQL